MGIGGPGARNAGLFAARILALSDASLAKRYQKFAKDQGKRVLSADKELQKERSTRKAPAKRSARK